MIYKYTIYLTYSGDTDECTINPSNNEDHYQNSITIYKEVALAPGVPNNVETYTWESLQGCSVGNSSYTVNGEEQIVDGILQACDDPAVYNDPTSICINEFNVTVTVDAPDCACQDNGEEYILEDWSNYGTCGEEDDCGGEDCGLYGQCQRRTWRQDRECDDDVCQGGAYCDDYCECVNCPAEDSYVYQCVDNECDISGCTDSDACNYNPDANLDCNGDNSCCEFENEDDDGVKCGCTGDSPTDMYEDDLGRYCCASPIQCCLDVTGNNLCDVLDDGPEFTPAQIIGVCDSPDYSFSNDDCPATGEAGNPYDSNYILYSNTNLDQCYDSEDCPGSIECIGGNCDCPAELTFDELAGDAFDDGTMDTWLTANYDTGNLDVYNELLTFFGLFPNTLSCEGIGCLTSCPDVLEFADLAPTAFDDGTMDTWLTANYTSGDDTVYAELSSFFGLFPNTLSCEGIGCYTNSPDSDNLTWLETFYDTGSDSSYPTEGDIENLDEWLMYHHGPDPGNNTIETKLPLVMAEYGGEEISYEEIVIEGGYVYGGLTSEQKFGNFVMYPINDPRFAKDEESFFQNITAAFTGVHDFDIIMTFSDGNQPQLAYYLDGWNNMGLGDLNLNTGGFILQAHDGGTINWGLALT